MFQLLPSRGASSTAFWASSTAWAGSRSLGSGLVARHHARLLWALASSGLRRIASRFSRIASRNAAMASGSLPWSRSALPRLLWASAKSGFSADRLPVLRDGLVAASAGCAGRGRGC